MGTSKSWLLMTLFNVLLSLYPRGQWSKTAGSQNPMIVVYVWENGYIVERVSAYYHG